MGSDFRVKRHCKLTSQLEGSGGDGWDIYHLGDGVRFQSEETL